MASKSTARPSPTPLRRRINVLECTRRSISTAGASTRNGEEDEDADSPPTFDDPESPDYEHEQMEDEEADELGGMQSTDTQAEEEREAEDGEAEFEDHDVPAPRPWDKPSIPVLLALAPPIGNWFTGDDHLKDLLLLLFAKFPSPPTTPRARAAHSSPPSEIRLRSQPHAQSTNSALSKSSYYSASSPPRSCVRSCHCPGQARTPVNQFRGSAPPSSPSQQPSALSASSSRVSHRAPAPSTPSFIHPTLPPPPALPLMSLPTPK
ncbi:hypothetical protein K438DRAFT_365022 [Mycena galopus ATCC 62051]|nr:hypothetical protein K438DRAFT_365022 [Mycena galopus ATCC 62051]